MFVFVFVSFVVEILTKVLNQEIARKIINQKNPI